MSSALAAQIERTQVPADAVGLWWLAQAGFAFKTGDGTVVYLDPYLTDAVEKAFGFKRLSLAPIGADEVRTDWLISSHEHLDHLDTEALPIIARNNSRCRFAGPESCQVEYEECGINASRTVCLMPDAVYDLGPFAVRTVRADHGDLSPSALSLRLDFGGVSVLFTGDTAFRPAWLQPLFEPAPDVFLACINGRFGNLDAAEAAELAAVVKPRLVIPCHFWMFMEHGGDPAGFVEHYKTRCPGSAVTVLSPGEGIVVSPSTIQKI